MPLRFYVKLISGVVDVQKVKFLAVWIGLTSKILQKFRDSKNATMAVFELLKTPKSISCKILKLSYCGKTRSSSLSGKNIFHLLVTSFSKTSKTVLSRRYKTLCRKVKYLLSPRFLSEFSGWWTPYWLIVTGKLYKCTFVSKRDFEVKRLACMNFRHDLGPEFGQKPTRVKK